jgi:hypothetical protein
MRGGYTRFALMLCALAGCGEPGGISATAPMAQTGAGMSGVAGAFDGGVQSGTGGVSAGVGAGTGGVIASPPSAAAGVGGAAGAADAGTPVCKIPDTLMLLDSDADGDAGLAPDCQNVPRKVIANNCIGGYCHDSDGPPAGNLDLMKPCVADRLVNVKSECYDLMFIDTAHPENSFLLDKLNPPRPMCGEPMPSGGHLGAADLACMNAWVKAVLRVAK